MPFISMSGFIPVAAILMILTGVQAQYSVIFSSQSLCAVIGSAVKIRCKIQKPKHQRVSVREWYRVLSSNGDTQDLNTDPRYTQRISESTWRVKNCELTLQDLRLSDSGVYNFRFKTKNRDWISASSGVYLNVTDLQVKVDSKTVRQRKGKVRVICSSTCSLSTNSNHYRWFRDNQYVSNGSSIELPSTGPYSEFSYSCEVYGSSYRSPAVYSPKNTTAVLYPSEVRLEGDSVSLSCSSDANPPVHTYSWFMQTVAADTLLITEQNYSITDISSEHSGFYYCTAQNKLGQQNSTLIHLKIFNSEENSGVKHFLVGLFIFLALLLITGTLWIWRRKSRSAKDDRKTGQSGQTSPSRGRPGSDDQDGFLYANVHFKPSPTEDINPYSTVQHPLDTTQEKDVHYTAVKFIKDSTATKPVTADDPALLYSVILKNKPTT